VQFFDRLDAVRERWNVLEHPFYTRWSEGELTRDELSFYAGEYRHAVVALADGLAAAAREAEPEIRTTLAAHAAEESSHVALWDAFGAELDSPRDAEPRAETAACAEAWTAGRGSLERLVTAYAVESAQPAISQTKLDGLLEHYGFEEGPATEYFALHAERDVEHAAQSRELIARRLDGADEERLLELAEGALRGNWELLDGVERARADR
jgi:pyrroloquinoline-quinone synthase